MNSYRDYYLRDNPFPATPIVDPSKSDDRINGTIYSIYGFANSSTCTLTT